jgi:hypothetical protein
MRHLHAACPCFMSMSLRCIFIASYSRCMSTLHVLVTWPYYMNMLRKREHEHELEHKNENEN